MITTGVLVVASHHTKRKIMRQQFREIRLRNFRCFHTKQIARVAPLTLLIGDNSTGKTSFLAAVRAVWEAAYQSADPDFRAPPYDLGAFADIVHNPGNNSDKREDLGRSFELGFAGIQSDSTVEFDATFESHAAAPYPAAISVKGNGVWIKFPDAKDQKPTVEFGSGNRSWRFNARKMFPISWPSLNVNMFQLLAMGLFDEDDLLKTVEKQINGQKAPSRREFDTVLTILQEFAFFHQDERPFASAPIRSSPRRTYDPTRPLPDPEGANVPTYFASVNFGAREEWKRLKEQLESFGHDSGLFHEINVKQLGDVEGGPFQLEVKKLGKRKDGANRNLIDVGYGVSQVLPVIAELFRQGGAPVFLFQQPEVHLHPSAQAALGSLFCKTASAGRQLIIETHSDYILDRILLDIRDKRTELNPDDVSILYFERDDQSVSIHSIKVNEDGSVRDTPEGYRRFFADELKRVIDY